MIILFNYIVAALYLYYGLSIADNITVTMGCTYMIMAKLTSMDKK